MRRRRRSPLAVLLKYHRSRQGLSQKGLAYEAGLSVKALSALESGRRLPPNEATLRKLSRTLELSDRDLGELVQAATYSNYTVRIPDAASPDEMRLVHRLVRAVGRLTRSEIRRMASLLGDRQ